MGDEPNPKAHGKKSEKHVVEQRVREIVELKLVGRTRTDILQHGSKWGISDRQIDELIKRASDQLQEINSESIKSTQSVIVSAMWDVYRMAQQMGNITEMRQCLSSIAKVMGLEQSTVNHIIRDEQLQDLDEEALNQYMNKAKEERSHIQ